MCTAIVDLQGFRDEKNKFILKELAILKNGREMQHFLVKKNHTTGICLIINHNLETFG